MRSFTGCDCEQSRLKRLGLDWGWGQNGISYDSVVYSSDVSTIWIPVAANDVAFSIHAVLSKAIVGFQILIYERGDQTVSKACISIIFAAGVAAAVCTIIAWPNHSWLWLISVLNSMQVFMTVIKNFPQAYMNYMRKSTEGFSIVNMLLEMVGGLAGLAQLGVQAIDQGSFVNFYGNIGKTLLSLEVFLFALLFIFQHYVLYPRKEEKNCSKLDAENTAPLLPKDV